MKYAFAALAVVAAVVALLFRPPSGGLWSSTQVTPMSIETMPTTEAIPAARERKYSPRSATPGPLMVYVAGEVVSPGVYAFSSGLRANDALRRAGGARPDADLLAVNLAAPLVDGEELAFSKIGTERPRLGHLRVPHADPTSGAHRHSRRHRGHAAGSRERPLPPPESVDLNSASVGELEELPGIGPALAERIIAYRDENGPFASVDELADVSGITEHIQDEVASYLTVR